MGRRAHLAVVGGVLGELLDDLVRGGRALAGEVHELARVDEEVEPRARALLLERRQEALGLVRRPCAARAAARGSHVGPEPSEGVRVSDGAMRGEEGGGEQGY